MRSKLLTVVDEDAGHIVVPEEIDDASCRARATLPKRRSGR